MSEVNIKVNDENIPLNEFMENMLKHLLLGYLNAAKGIPEDVKSSSYIYQPISSFVPSIFKELNLNDLQDKMEKSTDSFI